MSESISDEKDPVIKPSLEEERAEAMLRSITPEDTAIRRRAVTALLRSLLSSKRTLGR